MASGSGGSEPGEPEFQVAPMVDVLLTILVFFMTITSAQVLKVYKAVQLPIAKDAQKKDNSRAEAILNLRCKLPEKKALFVFEDKTYRNATDMVVPLRFARIVGEEDHSQYEPNIPSCNPRRSRYSGDLCVAGHERLRGSRYH
jgi:hypothetical protein